MDAQLNIMKRGFLSVDFEEGDQSTYKGIDFLVDKEKTRFDSGNITIDFINCIKSVPDDIDGGIGCSSSWDHFFMDGDDFKFLYIEGMGYPVPLDINDFEGLKTYYRKHNEV